ncbi:hypothetical protein KAR91_75970 [Candidatus Pacearchaeota archaeon]|nr:hypothetical protein [Candidatus Pacearchaeota archaeon]
MNKKSLTIAAAVLVAVIILGVYFYPTPTPTSDYRDRNIEMEQGFIEIMNKVTEEQAQKGITISFENIKARGTTGRVQGEITLVCEVPNIEIEEEVVQDIMVKLSEKYPEHFSENNEKDSWVDVVGCSETGSTTDGINYNYSPAEWRIWSGEFGPII